MNPVIARTLQATPVPAVAASRAAPVAGGFSEVLRPMVQPTEVEVGRGQTLTSIVKGQWAASGGAPQALTDQQAHRWALQVARDNGLKDANLILPGQRLMVRAGPSAESARLALQPAATFQASAVRAASMGAASVGAASVGAIQSPPVMKPSAAASVATSAAAPASSAATGAPWPHPVLGHTLERAVARGYVPAQDQQAVAERIAALADKHGFKPDDFARAVLMESDGLNPKANNGRCFGIIQFCSGPDRGAASAGYGRNAQEILKLSVLEQLDLVDRYFDDTRLSAYKAGEQPVRLDDLYLTILMPAARQEKRPNAALPIPGLQALDLHAQRDRQLPITRQSILSGLYANARDRLGQLVMASAGK